MPFDKHQLAAWVDPAEVRCWVGGIGWLRYASHSRTGSILKIHFEKVSKIGMDELEFEFVVADELLEGGRQGTAVEVGDVVRLTYTLARD